MAAVLAIAISIANAQKMYWAVNGTVSLGDAKIPTGWEVVLDLIRKLAAR